MVLLNGSLGGLCRFFDTVGAAWNGSGQSEGSLSRSLRKEIMVHFKLTVK